MSLEILRKTSENKVTSIEDFVNSDKFDRLSDEAQRTARLIILYGKTNEQQAILEDKKRNNLLGFSYVGFHEIGHKLAALEIGGRDVKAKILGIGEGMTTWMHSFKNSVSQFFLERMFVGFAGRKAIESLGFRSKGHGSDMNQVNRQAQLYEVITGKSGEGLKNQAESWAESFVGMNQNRILREGLEEAIAA